MNQKNRSISIAVILTLVLAVSACASFVRTSYVTVATVAQVVDVARGTYADFYAAGKVPQPVDDKVLIAYTKYQKSMHEAVSATRAYELSVKAAGTGASTDAVNKAIDALQLAVNDLFSLFTKAGLKTETPTIQRKV